MCVLHTYIVNWLSKLCIFRVPLAPNQIYFRTETLVFPLLTNSQFHFYLKNHLCKNLGQTLVEPHLQLSSSPTPTGSSSAANRNYTEPISTSFNERSNHLHSGPHSASTSGVTMSASSAGASVGNSRRTTSLLNIFTSNSQGEKEKNTNELIHNTHFMYFRFCKLLLF